MAEQQPDALPALPAPNCSYADHSYPAYNKSLVLTIQREAFEAGKRAELSRLQAAGGQGVDWPALPELPTHARLYYTGSPARRYKRASVCNGPGESLVMTSTAIEFMRRRDAQIRAAIAAHPPAAPALVPLSPDVLKALEWLERLSKPDMYGDRLGPLRDWLKASGINGLTVGGDGGG